MAASVLALGDVLPCLVVCVRAPAMEGLVALELRGVLSTLVLLLLAEAFGRSIVKRT